MVFENIVAYLLDKYLKDYIENLDTKKFQIDLWNGNVVLENLYLKPNALADLNLPVTISFGYLEKLTLQVPWQNLYLHPTKATVDGLFLLVVPKAEVDYDAKRDEKEQHEAKMKEVHKIEELRKEQEALENATPDKNNDTLMERMQLQIIRNLELSIRNIHVVYEDKSTKPDHPFAFGFTLNYITLHTTTPDWKPTILKEDTPLIHKLGDLSALSVYWNTNAQSRSGLSREEILKNLRQRIAVDNQRTPTDISYILRPLNIKAKIILVMKPRKEEFKRPMFDIKVDLDEISLNINRDQYSDLLDYLEIRDYLSLQSKYIKYRVKDDVQGTVIAKRWKFAYEAIVNEAVRPRFECYKWENIKLHLDRCREYRSLHFQNLLGKATAEQKQRAEELEKKLDVFNLTYIRRSADIEAKKKKEQEPKTWWGSVSNWWGGNNPQNNPELDLEKVMTLDEKKKLYDAIGYEGEDTSTKSYPKEYIDIDLAIRLNLLDVNVWSKADDNDAQIIARATIPDTSLVFKRRPAMSAVAVFVDLGSFQVFGIATDLKQPEFSNDSRPVLAGPVSRLLSSSSSSNQQKLLQIEFETNPLDKSSDYRIKVVAQSLEIKYNAKTINKLAECFEQDTQRNLQGVKQVAYSTYTDVKHRSYILMKHNIEKIKVLDIDIDLQSAYFLLPEGGIYEEGIAVLCMDFGHLTLKRDTKINDSKEHSSSLKEAKDIEEARERSYTQFKLKLENVQLIYATRNESWTKACKEKSTSLHLIRPMELDLDVGKCIYSDDAVLPAWKVSGKLPSVVLRLSDKRLFQIVQHIQSIEFPQSKHQSVAAPSIESESIIMQSITNNPEQTLEVVEGMTPVKKTKEKVEAEENKEKKIKNLDANDKKKEYEHQLTQLEAAFTLDEFDLHIDDSENDRNEDEPFLRLTLQSIVAKTKIKTFDMEFDASLANLIVYHEQFIGKDNQQLRLLSAQLEQTNNYTHKKLVSLNLLHTSSDNPLFLSPTYNGIENRAYVHFSKLVVTLQLEALLSILKFQDSLMKKLPQDTSQTQAKDKQQQEQKSIENNKTNDKMGKIVKKNDVSATPSIQIDADLEEFRIILASKQAKLFDIQVQGIKAYISQAPEKTSVNLLLSDLCVLDPYKNARYRKIISQQGDDKALLRVDLSLFNYAEGYEKSIDTFDCDVKVQFAKANIVFLFKHIDAVLGFLDSLNITKAALNIASTQADAAYEQVQRLQEQAFKVHLDITFNAPNIIIPVNSYSDQALLLDLGKLILNTSFYDDPKRFLVEQQNVHLENVLASRIKLDADCNIIGEAILLQCAKLNTSINRLLYPEKVKTEPAVSIKAEWDLVHFRLAKDDYSCIMRVLMENFSENIRDQIPEGFQNEQYRYREEMQEKEEETLRNAVREKQKASLTNEILTTLKFRAEIKKMALTLYLGESDLSVRRGQRNANLKLANVQIEALQALFRQSSDGSYKATARIKNFLLDDLRETNKATSVTRMMDRHFTVDPNAHMFVTSFEFKPKSQSRSLALRQLTAQLESLYICISLDYLMTLQDFFISGLPSGNVETPKQIQQASITTTDQGESDLNRPKIDKKPVGAASKLSATSSKPTTSQITTASNAEPELETRIDVSVKNPEVILLEDQHNANSNCLVLDLALQLRMMMIGNETQLYGWLKNLTAYSSNFAELRESNDSGSKIKYRILQPAKIDIFLSMNNEQQKIDVRISDIIVSIAPAAIRTLIGVTSSLGTLQSVTKEETEKINIKTLFNPQSIKDKDFWFTKDYENQSKETNELQHQGSRQEDVQIKENQEIQKPLAQKLILTLETIEIKLEVGLGSVTKSVAAMCLSNLTADVQNWSSIMTLASTVNVEAALYNENVLAWEPLIEPTITSNDTSPSPWCITCSISPALPLTETPESSSSIDKREKIDSFSSSKSKQMIAVRADQLLNITITKTGLDLIQRLSALFNDVYNKRLPPSDDDDQPMLSLFNVTGQDIIVEHLDGLQFANDPSLKSFNLKFNESIPLNLYNEHPTVGRLSVIDEQNFARRQEFTIKIRDVVKTVSISRTLTRVYELGQSLNTHWPIQLLCDAQIQNERRRITLSSIVRIYNNTTLPLLLLNANSTDPNERSRVTRIEVNKDYYVPIDLLYTFSNLPIFIAVDEGEDIVDFFSFDWEKEFAEERTLKLKNGIEANFIVFKELISAYLENTDQAERAIFHLHIHSALYLTNLLPIDVECSVDNVEQFALQPSQLHLVTSGKRSSNLKFTIPSYDNIRWVSDIVDLNVEGKGDKNEHLVIFHNETIPDSQQILRMILRVDAYHESYRLLLFSPFWILNRTDLKIDFQIDNNRTFIDVIDTPYLVCPENFTSEASKKGQIYVHGTEQTDSGAKFSEKFSLDVIKSTGLTSCKISNNRTYMICVDIATSSFGLTKLVTLSPAMVIINKLTTAIEIVEILSDHEQEQWEPINPGQLIPFWPRNTKDISGRIRYEDNRITSNTFKMNQKHRTLLRMDDEERPAILVEVTATDFDGVKVIFEDYKIGDVPLLIVNCLNNNPISFSQVDDVRTVVLPELNYVYYTWIDPLQSKQLLVLCGSTSAKVDFTSDNGSFGQDGPDKVAYKILVDGIQTVLLFIEASKMKESIVKTPTLVESMDQHIQIGIHDIGISIVNDTTHEEILYISLNKSKVFWTELKKNRVKPLSNHINALLEDKYKHHTIQCEMNPDDRELPRTKYEIDGFREVSFQGDIATLIHSKHHKKIAKRQALDGLWIDYSWSASDSALHIRINRVQIDNQLDYTIFPVMLYPILPKGSENDHTEKPFIELSIYQTSNAKSNIMQFKYFKILIQEFAVQIDQGFIVAILAFFQTESNNTPMTINMNTDLEQIKKPLDVIIKGQIESPSSETEMYFDLIHLSPLKIHVSFSMHGSKPTEELLTEYPLVGFLLQTLNVAEVQDVILRLGYYERNQDRFTTTKITKEVTAHYQNQFMKQIHVLVLGLDVLGNPLGVIRGLAEGVESFFYEPYKGAVQGPMEFAEGVATGVRVLFGSAVGGAAGAFSKITSVVGKGLANLTFDEDYKALRIRRKQRGVTATTHIAISGKNVVMGFVDGFKGVVSKPIAGARHGGTSGFFKGLGQGVIGLVARPTGGVVDFASTSFDLIKRTAQQEEIAGRIRYPRHVGRDGLVRSYVDHEAVGFYILNRLEEGKYIKSDTYVAHITCSTSPKSWLLATSKRLLFVTEISFLGLYELDWEIEYEDLKEEPIIKISTNQIQILTKEAKTTGTIRSHQSYGKLVKYIALSDAKYIVNKISSAMHIVGF